MSYLTTIPRSHENEPATRAVTVVSPGARDVVYLDQSASIEVITEALKAWGIRVRNERKEGVSASTTKAPTDVVESTWETTRPTKKTPTRLENVLSPMWFPVREIPVTVDPGAPWSWFGRAA